VKVLITGIGWVNSAGCGQGRQAAYRPGLSEGRLKLSAKHILDKPIPRYGRMDEYSRLGLLAIALALKDAGLDQWTEMRNISIVSSTVYGCLQTDADYYDTVRTQGGRLASPNLFAYTLSNTFLGEVSIYFGLTGAGFILQEPVLSGLSGLFLSLNTLARKESEVVITGVCDTGPPPSLGLSGRAVPSALFFVLRPAAARPRFSYGSLTQEKNGMILFDGRTVEDLGDLAGRCTLKQDKIIK
jgi:3-oxoacyl-[acyl-carrier-protein] synthase II